MKNLNLSAQASFIQPQRLFKSWGKTRILLLLVALLLVLLMASSAAAIGITVNSFDDMVVPGDGYCTLREAITNANNDTDYTQGDCAAGDGADTIFLDSGTYSLYFWDGEVGGPLSVWDELSIVGTGAGSTIIDASGLENRAFYVSANTTLSKTTVSGGYGQGSGGGIVVTEANLTLVDSEVSNNTAVPTQYDPGKGGGIYLNTGELRLENSTVVHNSAGGDGGGIYVDSYYSSLTLLDSAISSNASSGQGGGIANRGGSLTIERSTIDGNTAVTGGGGLYNSDNGYGSISQSTIANNIVGTGQFATNKFGGGIKNVGAESSLDISNSTISGNTAADDGGGLYNNTASISLLNVTIANNHALSESGGIDNYGYVYYENSIIAGNTAVSSSPDCRSLFGWPLVSNGFNLVGNGTGCTTTATDLTVAPGDVFTAVLAPLANNGGSTPTHALQENSPALDAANPDTCPEIDQRGVTRPQMAGCDIGAFEASDIAQTGPVFTVNTADDSDDGLCSLTHCSLREAILAANSSEGSDTIRFDIPQTYWTTIAPYSALPAITDAVTISNYQGSTFIELSGEAVDGLADGLLLTGGGSTIEGLAIHDFSGAGISVADGSGNTFTANSIYNNGGLGIDLGGDGVTTNDVPDADGLTNFPIIIRAVPDGYGTAVTGIYHGQSNSSSTLEFFSSAACDPSGFGEGQQFLGSIFVTTNDNGNASFNETLYNEGQEAPTAFITATATDADGSTSEFSQCAEVGPGNDSWPRALNLPLTPDEISPEVLTGSYDQFIDKQDQSRWFKIQVQPGSQLVVTLTGLPENYDLTVYKDIAATFNEMLAADNNDDLLELTAEFAPDAFSPDAFSPDAFSPDAFSPDAFSPDAFSPDAFSPDAFSPDAFSPDAFSPDAFSPDAFSPDAFSPDAFSPDAFSPDAFSPDAFSPDAFSPDAFSSAQTRSLIGVSAFNGTASEGISLNTWESSGDFYIRVRGRNGAFNTESPFHLAVVMTTGTCSGVSTTLPAFSIVPAANNYNTIILADLARLTTDTQAQADVLAKLNQLAARPEVNGVVVDVSSDARVAAANAQADTHPTCPFAKNLVAYAIKDIVDGYRSLNPLQYVVIIGSDDVIPFFRHPDQALLANERNYVPPVRDNTASQASLKLGYFLSQDRYGAGREISSGVNSLPIPNLAVGRLVETPGEVMGMIDAYLTGTTSGVVPTPASALVTGYDFLEDAANAVTAELEAGIGNTAVTLITPRDLSPQDPAAWTADDLRTVLLGSRHDITYLAGHFSASSALAADYNTRLLASEVAASSVDLTNALIFSAGCHSGYNIVNAHGIPGVTSEPDWAQAFAQKQATLIAGTGYQYGDTDFIEYSERLYLEFSRQLRLGTGPVSIGQALVAAKQVYLAETPQMRPIHEKALLESTLFGLPFLQIDMPAGRGTPVGDGSIVTGTTGFATNPGLTLGLQYADVTITPSLTTEQTELDIIDGSGTNGTVTATYLRGSNGVFTNPAEPVLPLERRNVSMPGTVLRGVGFRGGSFTDLPNILPLTGAATTEIRGVHPPFLSSVFYPVQFWRVNYFDALANSGGVTRLSVSPAQYRSDSPGSLTGTLRQFNNVDFRLYYSNYTAQSAVSGSNPALSAAPSIANVATDVQGGDMRFFARVVGDPAAGIQEVWVTFTALNGPYAGQWQSLDLAQHPDDSTRWQGALPLNGTAPEDGYRLSFRQSTVWVWSVHRRIWGAFLTATAALPHHRPHPPN
ncbi:MAG: CSLREA domain-containing protein [Ardenticatenaceae bacterium]|nr:CSLREA domain-containing protein [Ardenticatenaceae bacterium]